MRRSRRAMVFAVLAAIHTLAAAQVAAQTSGEGRMRILGRATVEAVPDHVRVHVGVTNKAPSPTAALDQNSAIARKMIDFAKKFGIDERDIRSDSITLAPASRSVREPTGNVRQEPDGYTASNTIRIRLSDMSRLGTFMRQVLDQGATNIGGVNFGLSDPDKYLDEARRQAVDDAARQAQLLAAAAKVKLGPIQEIVHPPRTEFNAGGQADLPARRRMAVPVEVGVVEITSEVEVTWRIE